MKMIFMGIIKNQIIYQKCQGGKIKGELQNIIIKRFYNFYMGYSKTIFLVLIATFLINLIVAINTNGYFVVTWLAGHCEHIQNTCDPNIIQNWDHASFTIKGLELNHKSTNNYGSFNISYFKGTPLLEQMINYWPPQPKKGGKVYYLWEDQWKKFGHSFIDIIKQQKRVPNDIRQLQKSYFSASIAVYKDLKVRNMQNNYYSRNELANAIGISSKSFYLVCNSKGNLREIRICVKMQGSNIRIYQCGRADNGCTNSMAYLKDWNINKPNDAKNAEHNKKPGHNTEEPVSDAYQQQLRDKMQNAVSTQSDNEIQFGQILDILSGFIVFLIAICWLPLFFCYVKRLLKKNKSEANKMVREELVVQKTNTFQLNQRESQQKQFEAEFKFNHLVL